MRDQFQHPCRTRDIDSHDSDVTMLKWYQLWQSL